MGFKIQRTPRGLADVLSIFGGQGPQELEERVRAQVDALQFYGLSQAQFLNAASAGAAIGAVVSLTVPPNQIWLLYSAHAVLDIPVGCTGLRLEVSIGQPLPAGNFSVLAVGEPQYAALVVPGQTFRVPYVFATPRVLLPGYTVQARLASLVGAAAGDISVNALVGVLG